MWPCIYHRSCVIQTCKAEVCLVRRLATQAGSSCIIVRPHHPDTQKLWIKREEARRTWAWSKRACKPSICASHHTDPWQVRHKSIAHPSQMHRTCMMHQIHHKSSKSITNTSQIHPFLAHHTAPIRHSLKQMCHRSTSRSGLADTGHILIVIVILSLSLSLILILILSLITTTTLTSVTLRP